MEVLLIEIQGIKSMLAHWLELRRRLLKCFWCFMCCFAACFYCSDLLLHAMLMPLFQALPDTGELVFTRIGTSLFLPIELASTLAMFLTLPYALFELWQFALPGLYTQERQGGWFFLIGSLVLFLLGTCFCFWIILPWLFRFLAHYTPTDIHLMLDGSDAIHLMIYMMTLFGLCFQLPLVCLFLERMNWVSLTQLTAARRYIIVAAFITGMLLAPPDVASQTLIALPLCALFELGVFCIKLIQWKESSKSVAFFKENE